VCASVRIEPQRTVLIEALAQHDVRFVLVGGVAWTARAVQIEIAPSLKVWVGATLSKCRLTVL
jgi:hypothetical protein